jgi:3-dehydroquinate synthase
VPVETGTTSYEILLGQDLLLEIPQILDRYAPAHRYALICDQTVGDLYGHDFQAALGGTPRCSLFSFPPGEKNKTRETWASLTDRMLEEGFGRDAVVVALGGGVSGDIAGFVAATYLRGIPCVQVPTSLLAMIDSSIGGKTGVDTIFGKNLVGAFHQPSVVVIDCSTLATLPDEHTSAGIAEAIKHGAIADAHYLDWIVAKHDSIRSRDVPTTLELVRRSIDIKAGIVSADETEQGKRAALNFGHTVGHALEATTDFELLHGEAVSIGMIAEAVLGVQLGITDQSAVQTLKTAIEALRLPDRIPADLSSESLIEAMAQDKKARRGAIRFTLLEGIGKVHQGKEGTWTQDVSKKAIFTALESVT